MVRFGTEFRPAAYQPVRLAQAPAAPAAAPLTAGQRQMAIGLGLAETGFGAVATWVGVRAGMREKSGLFSALGYAVAVGGGLFTIVNLLGTLGMIARTDAA